jgi:hypothetical protein
MTTSLQKELCCVKCPSRDTRLAFFEHEKVFDSVPEVWAKIVAPLEEDR